MKCIIKYRALLIGRKMLKQLAVAMISTFPLLAVANLTYKPILTLELAEKMAQGCMQYQQENNLQPLNIAIVDDGGHLILHKRQDGSYKVSADIAINKAKTAALTGEPTMDFRNIVYGAEGNENVRNPGLGLQPNISTVPGGFPVFSMGHTIGGFGVSGEPEFANYAHCAEAALSVVEDALNPNRAE